MPSSSESGGGPSGVPPKITDPGPRVPSPVAVASSATTLPLGPKCGDMVLIEAGKPGVEGSC